MGFTASHTGVLHHPDAVDRIVRTIEEVKTPFPPDHLRELDRGGYDIASSEKEFSAEEAYIARTLGHYMDAMIDGTIQPIDPIQMQFIDECNGRRSPELTAAKAWRKLDRLFPNRVKAERPSSQSAPRPGS